MGNVVKKTFNKLPKEAKLIPGYPTYYATPNGEIWRISPSYKTGFGIVNKKIIKLTDRPNQKTGYYQVQPYVNGKKIASYVHRLVLLTFEGECPKGFECDHIDADRSNNNINNLKWIEKSKNVSKALKKRWEKVDFDKSL